MLLSLSSFAKQGVSSGSPRGPTPSGWAETLAQLLAGQSAPLERESLELLHKKPMCLAPLPADATPAHILVRLMPYLPAAEASALYRRLRQAAADQGLRFHYRNGIACLP
ncbi:hypothetical protein ADP8_05261 (plasmid) [Roseomonas mucosa]|nr:hypothetical protein ADP8_05261 [Roseomonas mucosa]